MKTIQRFVLSLFPVLLEFLHYIYLLNSLWDQLKNEACEVLQVLIAMGKMQLLSFSYRKMYQFYFNPLTEKQTSNSTLVQIQCMRGHAASFSSTKETAFDFSRKEKKAWEEVTGRPECDSSQSFILKQKLPNSRRAHIEQGAAHTKQPA